MKKNFLVIIFFVFLSCLATYPLLVNFFGQVYGEPKDALVTVWHFWWLDYAHQHNLPALFIPFIAAPYGSDFKALPYYPVWNFTNMHLTSLLGEIAAYNLQIVLGFILSGLFMYYLVYGFTKNKMAALISGTIFTLSPYHFAQAFEHLGLSNMQWMVLYIFSLFNMARKKTYINAIVCGVCFSIVGFFDYYYLYFMTIFTGLFILFNLYYYRQKIRRIDIKKVKIILLAILIATTILLPCIFHIINQSFIAPEAKKLAAVAYVRPFQQLFADSARILNYFLPAHFHPIMGKITKPLIGTFLYGDNPPEQTLYLGYIGLLLAFMGFKQWKKKRIELGQSYKSTEENFIISFFLFSFFVFVIFSFPPYLQIGKIFIPFPSFFLYKLFPMFRNYARMGVLVLISMCVLAGFGLKYILECIASPKKRMLLCGTLGVFIFLEFLPYPPFKVIDTRKVPPVYEWLKEQTKDFIIAEYPIDADERLYLFYQRVHQKRMVNGIKFGTYADEVRNKIFDLETDTTPGILSFLGVEYVIVHKDRYRAYEGGRILGKVPDLRTQEGFRMVKNFGDIEVYELNAEPIDPSTVTLQKQEGLESDLSTIRHEFPLKDVYFSFKSGDSFDYTLKYMGIIPVAELEVEIGREIDFKNKTVIPIKARIYGSKFIRNFLEVKGGMQSLVNKANLSTCRYEDSFQIGNNFKSRKAVFDQQNQILCIKDKKIKIYPYTQDPLSAIFFLASHRFEPGRKIEIFINPGKSNYKLKAQVVGKEKVSIAGESLKCWQVKAGYFKFQGKAKEIARVTMWFDDNDKKTPMLIKASTKMGFLSLELKKGLEGEE